MSAFVQIYSNTYSYWVDGLTAIKSYELSILHVLSVVFAAKLIT